MIVSRFYHQATQLQPHVQIQSKSLGYDIYHLKRMQGQKEKKQHQDSIEQSAARLNMKEEISFEHESPDNYDYADMEYQSKEPEAQLQRPKQSERQQKQETVKEQQPIEPSPNDQPILTVSEEEKEWIIKEASMQRIGGTYDFFASQMLKYRRHLQARKSVLHSIFEYMNKSKITKANTVIMLKEYFKEYADICETFHEKSYKYDSPKRQEPQNSLINIRVELRNGFEKLFTLRKDIGNDYGRINKLIKSTIIQKIDKAIDIYYGTLSQAEGKLKDKQQAFKERESKTQKRMDKIGKVYGKGRYGDQIDEDVFVQMTKFVKEERQLRASLFDWGKQILTLRKVIIGADYNLMATLQGILTEYKNFNDTVYQLKKKKYNFIQHIKGQIQERYLFEKMCTPVDNDYVMGIINLKKKQTITLLKQAHYEQYFNEQFFHAVMGDMRQLLKGTVRKVFPLKSVDEEMVRTVSGNFVIYNKKTLQIKNKLAIANTAAEFIGQGRVVLTEKVKGIIFDSENTQTLVFGSNDRAEELIIYLSMEFGQEDLQEKVI